MKDGKKPRRIKRRKKGSAKREIQGEGKESDKSLYRKSG